VPRAGLTRERVVDEAAVVADEAGFERLSLAAVAERVGVRLPSLYKHIASLDALRVAVSVLGTRELAAAMTDAVLGKSGPDALVALCHAYHRYARAHPGRYAATVAAPRDDDPDHVEAADAALRVVNATLEGYGLRGDDAIDAARAVRAALHGFASLEGAGGFGLPRDVDRSFDRLVTAMDSALAGWPASSDGGRVSSGDGGVR
jgi:AcrR family transcriptional regulator